MVVVRIRTLGQIRRADTASTCDVGLGFVRDSLVYAAASVPAFAVAGVRGRDLVAGSLLAGFSVAATQVFFGSAMLGSRSGRESEAASSPSAADQPVVVPAVPPIIDAEVVSDASGVSGWHR